MTPVPVEAAKNIKNAAELWYNNIVAIKKVINEASAC